MFKVGMVIIGGAEGSSGGEKFLLNVLVDLSFKL